MLTETLQTTNTRRSFTLNFIALNVPFELLAAVEHESSGFIYEFKFIRCELNCERWFYFQNQ